MLDAFLFYVTKLFISAMLYKNDFLNVNKIKKKTYLY